MAPSMISLQGRRVTVMGLGRFGGGAGVTRWLASQGARVLLTDLATEAELAEPLLPLADLLASGAVRTRLGGHDPSDFTDTDLVVANPAVPRPRDNPLLQGARQAGVPITTEIGLLIERLPEGGRTRTIGVTGTVGKSTTTAMIAHALERTGRPVAMGGNIGGSLLERLDGAGPGAPALTAETWIVLELSSAMLHWIAQVQRWSPHVAVITNVAPNHLDWHAGMQDYVACKQHLFRFQRAGDTTVLGDASVAAWAPLAPGRAVWLGERGFAGALAVPGEHNRRNAAAALAACLAALPETPSSTFADALATFPGLPHRLQLCHRDDAAGLRFYNDSKCTTPDALLRAVEALAAQDGGRSSHLHLLVGGYDKKVDLGSVSALSTRVAGLYCIGATGPALAQAAQGGHVEVHPSLNEAVPAARGRMRRGDALVLSPACASWDQYPNYEHRGQHFTDLVRSANDPA